MSQPKPIDFLVECRACGVENTFNSHAPGSPAICNQCREILIADELNQSHKEYACRDCEFVLLMKNETPVVVGETACRCGSLKLVHREPSQIVEQWSLFAQDDESEEDLENFDWMRSGPNPVSDPDEYNDLFDQDAGHN